MSDTPATYHDDWPGGSADLGAFRQLPTVEQADIAPLERDDLDDLLAVGVIAERVRRAVRNCVDAPDAATITWLVEETLCQVRHQLRNTGLVTLPGIGTLYHDTDGAVLYSPSATVIDPEDCA